MTDNDPAATAALADMVAELDRLFPRRDSARTPIAEPGLCTSTTVTADDVVHRCVLHVGHADVHRDGDDPHTARGWIDDAPKPRTVDLVSDDGVTVTVADVSTTRLLERRLASARMSLISAERSTTRPQDFDLDALRAHVAELERSLAARKPPTVRDDVASVTS